MKLEKIIEITGEIEALTGLRIGGSSNIIEIGGNDNPIIRNPQNNEPYIPGSSLKGKMRSLLEWSKGQVSQDGKVHSCQVTNCPICTIFGRGAEDSKEANGGPTRITVRDAYLTEDSKKRLKRMREIQGTDTEIKYENNINRLNSSANPRNMERVPAGTKFEFNITCKIFSDDNEDEIIKDIYSGMKLISLDGVGGGISRGNGQIKFNNLKINGIDIGEDEIKLY